MLWSYMDTTYELERRRLVKRSRGSLDAMAKEWRVLHAAAAAQDASQTPLPSAA